MTQRIVIAVLRLLRDLTLIQLASVASVPHYIRTGEFPRYRWGAA